MSGTVCRAPVLVLGAASQAGHGVIEAAFARGWPVIAVAPQRLDLTALLARHRDADLTEVPGSTSTEAEAAALAEAVRALRRPLCGVVAAIESDDAAPRCSRLLDQPVDALRTRLDRDLLPHLAAARHLLPLLAGSPRGGNYVVIGGPGSECAWAGRGERSVAAAALRMLAAVLHDEARAQSVRLQMLSVDTPLRAAPDAPFSCPDWPLATEVGDRALSLLAKNGRERALPIVAFQRPSKIGMNSQDPDGSAELLPSRCLQDARTLLESIVSFPSSSRSRKVGPR